MKWLKIEKITFTNSLAERMQYRLDLVLTAFMIGLVQIVIPLYTLLLYGVSEGFPGWGVGEALLLASYVSLADAISSVFFQGIIWNTISSVRKGTMDVWLLAPTNPLSYFMNRSVDVEDLGRIGMSLLMCIYALTLIEGISVFTVLLLLGYLVVPIALYAAIAIFASAISMQYVDTYRIYDVIHTVTQLGKYPVTIFPETMRILLFTALPVAAAGYVPLAILLQNQTALLLLSAVFVLGLLVLSVWYWHKTLKNYGSAGG
ncbi:MAG: ABC-2 family transporter protein [Candidatus Woesearchaeota archaeon]